MEPNVLGQNIINKPLFEPTFLNVEYFFNKVLHFFQWIKGSHAGSGIYFVSHVLTLFGITLIIFCIVRMIEIWIDEKGHIKHGCAEAAARKKERETVGKNPRWLHVQDLVNSANSSDWRLAIIEADSILEGLLDARDLPGMGIGEKLKNISPGDLGSIQAAWEAHLVRNRIAHEGSEFHISQHEARRAIQLYEVVFRELGFL